LGTLGLIIVTIYAYPYLATWATVGLVNLPPWFSPDLYCHLNLSNLESVAQGTVINPWYGTQAATSDMIFSRFGLAFQVFDGVRHIVGGHWSLAILLWNMTWVALMYVAAVWFFRTILPERSPPVLALSLCVLFLTYLMWFSLTWVNLKHLRFDKLWLPYTRPFFPQVTIPLVLCYLGLQIHALKQRTWIPWLVMVVIQLVALAVFPYATLFMAAVTGSTLLGLVLSRQCVPRWSQVIGFGTVCGAADGTYLWVTGPPLRGYDLAHSSIVSFDIWRLSLLFDRYQGTVVAMLTGAILISLLRAGGREEIKWTLVALGLVNGLLLLTDGVFSPLFQVSLYLTYFAHTTLAILVAYVSARIYVVTLIRFPAIRWLTGGAAAALVVYGALVAHGMYQGQLSHNEARAELVRAIGSLGLNRSDLVIAPARFNDDLASWIPLVTNAEVLSSREAEWVLPCDRGRQIHQYRRAVYLFLAGWDSERVKTVVSNRDGAGLYLLARIGQAYLLDLSGPESDKTLASIREGFVPLLSRIQAGDPETAQFFRNYRRVLFIDSANHPEFVRERLSRYLNLGEEHRLGSHVLLWARPA
jgi:hypothetical protein